MGSMRQRRSVLHVVLALPFATALALGCASTGAGGPGAAGGSGKEAFVYTSGSDTADIRVLRFDLDSGQLTPVGSADAGPGSGYLAWHPSKKYLYGFNRSPAKVLAYAINPADGNLTRINEIAVPGANGATHLSVHPSGKWVMVAFFGSGHVSTHPVRADGGVGEAADLQPTAPQAHHAMTAGDGKFLIVPCRDGNAISQFSIDAGTGKLTPAGQVTVEAGTGPRHVAFHPSRGFAYVINETNGTMTSYAFDAASGKLTDPQSVSNAPAGASENAAAHVEVHPNGRFVYGSNRLSNSIAIYEVGESGRLTPKGHETAGGLFKKPRDFTLDPSGKWMLVANQDTAEVFVFKVNDDGTLTLLSKTPVQTKPTFVGMIPR
jgi:6-phosphogluconolactonase